MLWDIWSHCAVMSHCFILIGLITSWESSSYEGEKRQDLWAEIGALERREALGSEIQKETDIQNGGKIKSNMPECRLIKKQRNLSYKR